MGTCMHYEPADFYTELSRFPEAKVFARSYSLDGISGLVYMFYGDGDIYYLDRLFTTDEKQKQLEEITQYDFHQELYRRVMLDERIRQESEEGIAQIDKAFLSADIDTDDLNIAKDYNIGYYFLQSLYNAFELDALFKELSKKYNCDFDLNYVMSYIIFSKVICPKGAFAIENAMVLKDFKPWTIEQEMKVIDICAYEKNRILDHLYKKYNEIFGYDTSVLYHDAFSFYTTGNNKIGTIEVLCDQNMIPMTFRNLFTTPQFTKFEQQLFEDKRVNTYVNGLNTPMATVNADHHIYYHKLEDLDAEKLAFVLKDEGWTSSPHNSIQYKRIDENKIALRSNELIQYLDEKSIKTFSMRYKTQYIGYYFVDTDVEEIAKIVKASERSWKLKEAMSIIPFNSQWLNVYEKGFNLDSYYIFVTISYLLMSALYKLLNNKYEIHEIIEALEEMKVIESKEFGAIPIYTMTPIIDDLMIIFFRSNILNSHI